MNRTPGATSVDATDMTTSARHAGCANDSSDDPSLAYERADSEDNQLELLRDGLAELDARSRDIIKRRWLDDENKATLQELADEYGVSAERVRQIEANALKKMKALFAA